MKPVIEINNLTKTYGKSRGVEGITLKVDEGTIFGFLGPNGAGKTTTISMLANLIRPTSGSSTIFGKDLSDNGLEIRRQIGYLTSDMGLDGHLTGWQQLEYYGNLRGNYDKSYVQKLAIRLDSNLKRKIRTLSRGNRQKVALISALMHKPKLLILDEPTSGLDPLIQAEFNKIILEHKAAGRTAFISSHVLSEVQELCDEVAFIRQGKLVTTRTMEDLTREAPKHITVIANGFTKLTSDIKKLAGVRNLQEPGTSLKFSYSGELEPLLALLSKAKPKDVTIEDTDLESMFMTYYEDDNGARDA